MSVADVYRAMVTAPRPRPEPVTTGTVALTDLTPEQLASADRIEAMILEEFRRETRRKLDECEPPYLSGDGAPPMPDFGYFTEAEGRSTPSAHSSTPSVRLT